MKRYDEVILQLNREEKEAKPKTAQYRSDVTAVPVEKGNYVGTPTQQKDRSVLPDPSTSSRLCQALSA